MKKLKIFLFLLFLFGIIIFMIVFEKEGDNTKLLSNSQENLYNENNCQIVKEPFKVNWVSMEPLIKNGSKVELSLNYYNCSNNIPKSWDIIIFENPFTFEKVIKKLSISPWDKLEVDEETWIIKINGDKFVNSAGDVYVFSELALKYFDIYTREDWIVKDWIYFIFWDNVKNSIDSRDYWPVSLEWILWKVEY